jgi:hypothetical protein
MMNEHVGFLELSIETGLEGFRHVGFRVASTRNNLMFEASERGVEREHEGTTASGHGMKIQIRARGLTLTRKQYIRLRHDLGLLLARFGERIDRVIVAISNSAEAGFKRCEIELHISPQLVRVVHSDPDVFVAVGHAAQRAARSARRMIDIEHLVRR